MLTTLAARSLHGMSSVCSGDSWDRFVKLFQVAIYPQVGIERKMENKVRTCAVGARLVGLKYIRAYLARCS